MSVLIVTQSNSDRGMIEVTLKNSGFEPRPLYTLEEAEYALQHDGERDVLVIDEDLIAAPNPRWRRFVERWPELGLVRLAPLPRNRDGIEPAPGPRLAFRADPSRPQAVRDAVAQARAIASLTASP